MKLKLDLIFITSMVLKDFKNSWDYFYIIHDLFKYFEVNITLNPNIEYIFIENAIIVYHCDSKFIDDKLLCYIKEYSKKQINFSLFHLSNECLNHDCQYYVYAKHVFRNYYDVNIKYSNVITLPLGYKGGFLNRNENYLKLQHKKYDVCFIGHIKGDRYNLVENIKSFDRKYLHTTKSWNDKNSLSVNLVQKIYTETILIPAPMGNVNVDSFRIYEILESGSIPVIKKYWNNDYFENIFGKHPIPTIYDWSELKTLCSVIKSDLNFHLEKINNWHISFKQQISNMLYNLLK